MKITIEAPRINEYLFSRYWENRFTFKGITFAGQLIRKETHVLEFEFTEGVVNGRASNADIVCKALAEVMPFACITTVPLCPVTP